MRISYFVRHLPRAFSKGFFCTVGHIVALDFFNKVKHFRVQHGNNEFANKHSHINGIESFWAYAKTRIVRFRGLAKHTFYFHLKECEFRFNHRNEDIYKLVLKMLREKPLC